jgi:hypothetical protein
VLANIAPMTSTTITAPAFRFSKLLRDAMRGETFSPGSRLRIARPIDAESLTGRHEGRGRRSAECDAGAFISIAAAHRLFAQSREGFGQSR